MKESKCDKTRRAECYITLHNKSVDVLLVMGIIIRISSHIFMNHFVVISDIGRPAKTKCFTIFQAEFSLQILFLTFLRMK